MSILDAQWIVGTITLLSDELFNDIDIQLNSYC